MSDLESLTPEKAVQMYLKGRDDIADNTLETHDYDLRTFVAWCDEEGITDMTDLTGRHLYEFRIWRREGGYSGEEVATITLRGTLATMRAFLRFCAEIDAADPELWDQVPLPSTSSGDDVSDSTLDPDRAIDVVQYLERYEYASRRHVAVYMLWHTGCRTGALRGLDLGDLDLDGDRPRGEGPAVHVTHRPETNTPLKNKEPAERWIGISQHAAEILRDYVDGPRIKIEDDHGRTPLLTTNHGRVSRSTIRDTLYRVTRPCWRGEGCPHDKDPDTCDWTSHGQMSKCPSSRSPHDVRSGRVTAYKRQDKPRKAVEERLNASDDILDKHYDRRSEREKAAQRRRFFDL